jgi:putative methanogenesis marker protein 8
MSGLISTTPIPDIIERVGRERVLDPETARIDPIEGVKKAIAMGYKNIAVSTMSGTASERLKALEREHGVNMYAFVMHTTGMPEEEAETTFKYADVATGCASKYIRAAGEKYHAFRVGSSVPIFGVSARGRRLIEERVRLTGKDTTIKIDAPQPDNLV